jgi:hypothetical protein
VSAKCKIFVCGRGAGAKRGKRLFTEGFAAFQSVAQSVAGCRKAWQSGAKRGKGGEATPAGAGRSECKVQNICVRKGGGRKAWQASESVARACLPRVLHLFKAWHKAWQAAGPGKS